MNINRSDREGKLLLQLHHQCGALGTLGVVVGHNGFGSGCIARKVELTIEVEKGNAC